METVTTGPFLMRSTCRRCHGKGSWNRHPCKECAGAGQTKQRHTVRVPVPAGIEDGQTVRMAVGSKEIFITFHVAPSDYFKRKGADVHTDAKVSLAQAALGGAIRVQVRSAIVLTVLSFVPSTLHLLIGHLRGFEPSDTQRDFFAHPHAYGRQRH